MFLGDCFVSGDVEGVIRRLINEFERVCEGKVGRCKFVGNGKFIYGFEERGIIIRLDIESGKVYRGERQGCGIRIGDDRRYEIVVKEKIGVIIWHGNRGFLLPFEELEKPIVSKYFCFCSGDCDGYEIFKLGGDIIHVRSFTVALGDEYEIIVEKLGKYRANIVGGLNELPIKLRVKRARGKEVREFIVDVGKFVRGKGENGIRVRNRVSVILFDDRFDVVSSGEDLICLAGDRRCVDFCYFRELGRSCLVWKEVE